MIAFFQMASVRGSLLVDLGDLVAAILDSEIYEAEAPAAGPSPTAPPFVAAVINRRRHQMGASRSGQRRR